VKTLPPLLSSHPRPVRFVLAVVVPVAYGAITGIVLGLGEPGYLVLSILGVLGGLGAGFDHLGATAGARRGVLGGTLFGLAILAAHELHGEPATADLPEPAILLAVVTAVLGAALGAIGGRLRERVESRRAVVPAEA
jgi:hypothetical protein